MAVWCRRSRSARANRRARRACPRRLTRRIHDHAEQHQSVVPVPGDRRLGALQEFNVDVIWPVRVERIDVKYNYAPGLGLESHTDEDGGDIYAPAGTKVQLTITTDKPVAKGQLRLSDGTAATLSSPNLSRRSNAEADQVLTADLVVAKDGSYRVALNDVDGLSNDGDTEYFIRMLNDRPPDVRILRPAGDKKVSPLEEVPIEARATTTTGCDRWSW